MSSKAELHGSREGILIEAQERLRPVLAALVGDDAVAEIAARRHERQPGLDGAQSAETDWVASRLRIAVATSELDRL